MKFFLMGLIAACFGLPLFAPETTICNPEKIRQYDDLFESANLVLIVEPLSVREANEQDKVVPPERLAKYLDGFVAHLLVLHVIKGNYKEDTLDLVHFKWKKDAQLVNAGMMANFNVQKERLPEPFLRYSTGGILLFLSKTKDGHYEFLTGQESPSQSVRKLRMQR